MVYVRTSVRQADAPSIPEASDRAGTDTRSPYTRPEWEAAVYAAARELPTGRKVTGPVFVAVLLRWASYANWSGGRAGTNGYPAVLTLAEECAISEKSVDRVLALAMEVGVLIRTSRRQGGPRPRPATYSALVPVTSQTGPLGVPSGPHLASVQTGPLGVPSENVVPKSDGTREGVRRDPEEVQTGPLGVPRSQRQIPNPTTSRREDAQGSLLLPIEGGGGGTFDEEEHPEQGQAGALIDALPPALHVGGNRRRALIEQVATLLGNGWTGSVLTQRMTSDLPSEGVRIPHGFLRDRLDGLPERPPTAPSARPVVMLPPKCRDCGPNRRLEAAEDGRDLGKCPTCHPDLVAVGA